MNDMLRISSFRDQWLEDFFHFATPHRKIPWTLATALERKLDMINAAMDYRDLLWPPGNRYEDLAAPLKGFSSIRVNEQYRLIFYWREGKAHDLYLDPHGYRRYR